MKSLALLFCCVAAFAFVGCGDDSVADRERQAQADGLVQQAMEAAENGDVDQAIALYRQVLMTNGSNPVAHLNLAMLADDMKQDYLEAVHHYQMYLELQPNAEKRALVEERLTAARDNLAKALGGGAEAEKAIAAERERLSAQAKTAQSQVAALEALVAEKDKTITNLEAQVEAWKRVVDGMKATETEAVRKAEAEAAARIAAQAEAAVREIEVEAVQVEEKAEEREISKPTSSEDIAAVLAESERMLKEPDGGLSATDEATRKAAEGKADEALLGAKPVPGKTYVVRPGDTLSSIAREAYGESAKWEVIREANRATISPDGRIQAGQTLIIP